ncbi:tetratricopeptide repeat protein, partial [Candidatus Sumerlaeota bacterium]|nr:tetratricopeptide repeat protein [Candidatus Sumerlaeota bacterium]
HLRRPLNARPDSFEAHNSLGAALASLGKFDEAIDHFRRAV